MKQYMLIQFKPTEDPNYYQSKNNIIQALNKGEFYWSPVQEPPKVSNLS